MDLTLVSVVVISVTIIAPRAELPEFMRLIFFFFLFPLKAPSPLHSRSSSSICCPNNNVQISLVRDDCIRWEIRPEKKM